MGNTKYLLILIIAILITILFLNYFMKEKNTKNNEQSKEIHPNVISEYIVREDKLNRIEVQNIIFLPVDVYIIKYKDTELNSTRNKENIIQLFRSVNKIWNQANISTNITKIEVLTVSDNSIYVSIERLYSYVIQTENYDKNKINAYFVKTLHGSNGIALPGNVIMVADRTTVFDFRATSHEIGHVLGLQHIGPVNRLMARGVNGFDLTDEEIEIARRNALIMFS